MLRVVFGQLNSLGRNSLVKADPYGRWFSSSATKTTPSESMSHETDWKSASSVYDFTAKDIDGVETSMEKYRGKVLLVVNVACKCGYTSSTYAQLQTMFQKYEADGLRIAGFSCNQFASQDPWPEAESKKFVTDNFNVTFDLFAKINVNGDNAHPLYKYLKHKQPGTLGNFIKWNFTKFLVDRQGQPIKRYGPNDYPVDFEDEVAKTLGVPKKP